MHTSLNQTEPTIFTVGPFLCYYFEIIFSVILFIKQQYTSHIDSH